MIGGVARRVSSPVLVGRDAEVARLKAALERAAAGRPAVVVVAGEAGVGKTRLVALVLTYRSDDLHRRHPLRPFLAKLGVTNRGEAAAVAHRLRLSG